MWAGGWIGKFEVATKRDLAKRDQEVTRLSSLLAAAERRAVDAEKRVLEEVEKREADVTAALWREREGREMAVSLLGISMGVGRGGFSRDGTGVWKAL